MTEGNELTYDQPLEIETAKAYAAFCVYRDMGLTRSIDRAYVAFCKKHRKGTISAPGDTAAPRHWKEWSVRNEWTRRAASYDAYLDDLNRKQAEVEHLKALQDFRDKCRANARRREEQTNAALDRIAERLMNADADKNEGTIAALMRAAAALGATARDDEALALGIDDLARRLEP